MNKLISQEQNQRHMTKTTN